MFGRLPVIIKIITEFKAGVGVGIHRVLPPCPTPKLSLMNLGRTLGFEKYGLKPSLLKKAIGDCRPVFFVVKGSSNSLCR